MSIRFALLVLCVLLACECDVFQDEDTDLIPTAPTRLISRICQTAMSMPTLLCQESRWLIPYGSKCPLKCMKLRRSELLLGNLSA